ncbi:MAG: hypothetical protein ABIP66_10070, partial [Gemmatimonadaceae bacterium]
MRHTILAALLLHLLTPDTVMAQSGQPAAAMAPAPDWGAVATAVVLRMQLQRGERVLLVGAPGVADALVAPLRAAVTRAGGVDLGAMAAQGATPDAWGTDFTRGTSGKSRDELVTYFGQVDVGVMLPGAAVGDAPYAAMQQLLRLPSAGTARTIHFHWAGAYGLDGELLPTAPLVARLYQDVLLFTDYAALARRQQEFEHALRRAPVRVTTPAGTDLTFSVGDRPVTRQDGDASARRMRDARNLIDREVELPAGVIRVAPLEESVQGTIAFPDGVWAGVPVTGLVMRFRNGVLASYTATSGAEGVERELQSAGAAGRAFREFALGFNPRLAIPGEGEAWIPYYGYGAGVVRLSLGDNTELGGRVGGGY